jgi:NAD(P)H-hydrate epimerase
MHLVIYNYFKYQGLNYHHVKDQLFFFAKKVNFVYREKHKSMVKIFPTKQVSLIDKYTIDNEPVLSLNLMERAAGQVFKWIQQNFPDKKVKVFAGPGNNGGDALALARMLLESKRDVVIYLVNPSGKFSPDSRTNLDKLLKMISENKIIFLSDDSTVFAELDEDDLVIDGPFGSGLNRQLEGLPLNVVQHINQSSAVVVSIDMPSGMFGEDNSTNKPDAVVHADFTLTFQFPKLAFLLSDYGEFTGQWEILDIGLHPKAIEKFQTDYYFLTTEDITPKLKKRRRFSHKGDYGHALLLSGSYGKMGAAILASRGCMKSGTGLLTTHVPHYGYHIIQISVPEAMVSIDRSDILISEFPDLSSFNAIGIGPGIGKKPNTATALKELLPAIGDKPLVMDADALNLTAENKDLLGLLPEKCIITPHPKEFDRLAGKSNSHYERLGKAIDFAKKYNIVVVLKTAYTSIVMPDGRVIFNSTGNPGMATAGSGDVLTGVILGLLAQGYSVEDAAVTGVFIHGLAGDIAAGESSEQGVTATDIIDNLSHAFSVV